MISHLISSSDDQTSEQVSTEMLKKQTQIVSYYNGKAVAKLKNHILIYNSSLERH